MFSAILTRIRGISCAHDKDLAQRLYDFLKSRPEVAGVYKEYSKNDPYANFRVEHMTLIEDEIVIDKQSSLTIEAAKRLIEVYVASKPDALKGYKIIESLDVLILSKVLSPLEADIELLTCDFCGYFTPYWADLFNHKKMHAVGSR